MSDLDMVEITECFLVLAVHHHLPGQGGVVAGGGALHLQGAVALHVLQVILSQHGEGEVLKMWN